MNATNELLHRLPKTDLHVHLDGSLRPQTMLEIGAELGIKVPGETAAEIGDYMHVKEGRDLVDYLARFELSLALMQTAPGIERIAYELAADSAAENIRYTEVRFCPGLNTKGGLSSDEVVDAALKGLRRAESEHEITTAVIICALRNLPLSTSIEMAELAIAYKDRGVVAFDLAGAEDGYAPGKHEPAFQVAADGNLAITIHAGEAFGPASIHQAVHHCHARRIGHGTRLWEDADLMGFINNFRIPLEICLTSNVQTKATPSLEEHPLRTYYDQGLIVNLNTDNRLMSATSMTQEFMRARDALGFTWDELCDIAVMGFESAFLPHRERMALVEAVKEEIAALNSAR